MTIARVIQVSGIPEGSGPPPEVQAAAEEIRACDGCEGMYLLRNSQTGHGLSVTLWRDQAALDASLSPASSGVLKTANDVARERGVSSSGETVYDIVTAR
jgi:heme-degrading monooxygenase HmoA